MNPAMNPFMQHAMMAQTGLPLGRRANGFGASPLGPGGPIPAHQLNFLSPGGMGGAGMLNSPFSAGRYPFPQTPMPMMPGMGGGGGMMGGGMNPLAMAYLQQLYLQMLLSESGDPDDTGVWDGDDEEGADIMSKLVRRGRRRRGGLGALGGLGGMGMMGGGMNMGMSPFSMGGMAPLGIM